MNTPLLIAASYLLGSVPFAYLLARVLTGIDLREVGSGNIGATNVLRSTRLSTALLVVALDAAKGGSAVWLAGWSGAEPPARAACGVAAVVGHVYPLWLRFRGGKGVATAFGAFAVVAPPSAAIAATVWGVAATLTRYASLASLLAAMTLVVSEWWRAATPAVPIAATVAATLILFRHRGNVARLLAGTERRLYDRRQAAAIIERSLD